MQLQTSTKADCTKQFSHSGRDIPADVSGNWTLSHRGLSYSDFSAATYTLQCTVAY